MMGCTPTSSHYHAELHIQTHPFGSDLARRVELSRAWLGQVDDAELREHLDALAWRGGRLAALLRHHRLSGEGTWWQMYEEAPYVCPGCYAVGGEPCLPGCIDDELRDREDADLYGDDDRHPED